MATRLAVLGFFHVRRVLREAHCQSIQPLVARIFVPTPAGAALPHVPTAPEYVRGSSTSVQDIAGGEVSAASPDRRDEVQWLPESAGREVRVRFHAFLRCLNVGVGATDGRRIEVSPKTCRASGELNSSRTSRSDVPVRALVKLTARCG